jgi:hypothetical protein
MLSELLQGVVLCSQQGCSQCTGLHGLGLCTFCTWPYAWCCSTAVGRMLAQVYICRLAAHIAITSCLHYHMLCILQNTSVNQSNGSLRDMAVPVLHAGTFCLPLAFVLGVDGVFMF